MIVERLIPSGAWQISGIVGGESNGYLMTVTYWNYSKREAIRLWKERASKKALS